MNGHALEWRQFLLAPLAIGCWLTAGLLAGAPDFAALTAAVLGALTLTLLVVVAVRRRRASVIALLAVIAAVSALVAISTATHAPTRQPAELVALGSERSVTATGTLTSSPVAAAGAAGGTRFRVELLSVRAGKQQLVVHVPAVVFAPPAEKEGARPDSLSIGSTIEFSGTMKATDAGDSSAFLFFARGSIERLSEASGPVAWAAGLRGGLLEASTALPGAGGRLLPGLAIGDVSAVDAELDGQMKASSLSHLTAVSGANCVLIVAAALALGAAFGLSRRWRVVLALVFLTAFVVLVTPEGSVIRASVMAAIVLVALTSGRPGRGLPALCLAIVVLLIIDPWISRNYGFALSVLATAGLLVLSGPLASSLARWMPPTLATVIALPLAAQLACQPVLVLLSPVVALYGVPANLLAAPAAPLATVAGLLACLVLPFAPWLATAALWVAWLPAAWIAAVAGVFSALPASQLPWAGGALGLAAAIVLTALILGAVLGDRMRRARWVRPASAFILSVLLVGSLTAAGVSSITLSLARPSNWQIALCDVGQGDAILVRTDAGVMLIDTGPDPAPLRECLAKLGINRIAMLVLTHFDLDHVGGAEAILGKVDTALLGPSQPGPEQTLVERLERGGASIVDARAGDRGALGELEWEVLWPPRAKPGRTETRGNPASVVVQTEAHGIRSIFLGDLGEESQQRLLPAVGAVDIVKVAHHGSGDQSARLYERLDARLGLISVGADNDYGHPADSILDILAGIGTVAARTDLAGMVLVVPGQNPGEITVWSERAESADAAAALGWNIETREARGCSNECIRRDEEGRDCPARVESGASGAHRFGVGHGEVSRRARDPPAARISRHRRPQPRSH